MIAGNSTVESSSSRNKPENNRPVLVVPLILDQQCIDAQLSAHPIPARVMEQFGRLRRHSRREQPQHIGGLFSSIIHSKDAVRLWSGGGLAVDSWNQCEIAAEEVALKLGVHEDRDQDSFHVAATPERSRCRSMQRSGSASTGHILSGGGGV
jgi:hypothetical protein